MQTISPSVFVDTKPHYHLLNGLRGVAALLVVAYHIFEGYAFAGGGMISTINHGYLAVDFFFMLSGFVIAYAYDDRWQRDLTLSNFIKRRLIRLHPLVIFGAVLGVITFWIQGAVQWDGTAVDTFWIIVALLCTCLFIPAAPAMPFEVRGNGEMFPLNGPLWTLFFEYIGNLLYALFIRRLSTKALAAFVALLGLALGLFAIFDVSGYGSIGVGWSLAGPNFWGGLLRMLFPFSMGMLLSRKFKPIKIKGAFWICALLLVGLFMVPYIEGLDPISRNGVYEMFCIAVVFPLIVWLGASGQTTDKRSTQLCKFFGDISYPIYVIHYPLMYLFYAWLIDQELYTLKETWAVALVVYLSSIFLAYFCLKLYDKPVRKLLARYFINQ